VPSDSWPADARVLTDRDRVRDALRAASAEIEERAETDGDVIVQGARILAFVL
jgi:hypothetical protein